MLEAGKEEGCRCWETVCEWKMSDIGLLRLHVMAGSLIGSGGVCWATRYYYIYGCWGLDEAKGK